MKCSCACEALPAFASRLLPAEDHDQGLVLLVLLAALMLAERPRRLTSMDHLQRAVELCGGWSHLAARLKVSPSLPSMWRSRKSVPAEHCPAIERETGGAVRCEDLRPDVDWAVLRASGARPAEAAA